MITQLQSLLDDNVRRWNIPGAVVSVLHNGEIADAAAGVSNLDTGEPMTPDTRLPYGSVSKVLTTTIILRLVETGQLDLDAPVTRYVPEFVPPNPESGDAITVRSLLCHSSGLVSTIFRDTGWGDDALERNVELINQHPQFLPTDELLCYCNSGMLLLGRIAEVVCKKNWHQLFQTELAQPLNIPSLLTRPEQALRHRYSAGHVRSLQDPDWKVAPYPFAFASHSPAGSTPSGRARDLLSIVRLYLGEGENAGFIGEDLIRQSWSAQCDSPASFLQAACGLGWWLFDWQDQTRMIGHDGSTMATMAFLRIHPDSGTAAALLVNCTNGTLLYDGLFEAIFSDLCGTWEPGVPDSPAGFVAEPERYEGAYEDLTGRLDLRMVDGKLVLHAEPNVKNKMPGARYGSTELHHHDVDAFYSVGDVSKDLLRFGDEKTRLVRPFRIVRLEDGSEYFHNGALAFRRVD